MRLPWPLRNSRRNLGKINLAGQQRGFYGQHRSGWPYVLRLLSRLHNPKGTLLDTFIERTFCWHPKGPRANLEPWIGFIHVPPRVPDWFRSEQSNEAIFATDLWQKSLPYCLGLFTLSGYHRRHLETKLAVPIENLLFPTETPELKWSWERFMANPDRKIIQIGWWLRRLHSIFLLPPSSYRKVFIRISHARIENLMRREREALITQGIKITKATWDTVVDISFVRNKKYDRLLAENLVLLHLYDSSANNTIIECIVRDTPVLVNPLESVVEYLGEEYPFYFNSLEEAAAKAEDLELVRRTHLFLKDHPIKAKLDGDYFINSFIGSRIYQAL